MGDPRVRTRPSADTRAETAPRTFQGRPILTMEWRGQEVEVVSGVAAAKLASRVPVGAERGLMAAVPPEQPPPLGIAVVTDDLLSRAERGMTALSTDAPFDWVEPLLLDRGSSSVPNDPYFSQQWALAAIDASLAWSAAPAAEPVLIAVLDSGLPLEAGRLSHVELDDAVRIVPGRDMVNNDDDPADDHGHGTHVLGIIAARRNNGIGIAGLWPGPVGAIKVFDSQLFGSSVTFKDGVAAAVDMARRLGARLVINYSGGGGDSRTKREAVEYAGQGGALVVAAAGNGSGRPIEFPAAYAGTLDYVAAVGATDAGDAVPAFASLGPELTVVAPGADVLSTLPNYGVTLTHGAGKHPKYDRLDGSSQAAPHVAALSALIWARRPSWSAAEVREHIRATADAVGGGNPTRVGSGRINVSRALSGL